MPGLRTTKEKHQAVEKAILEGLRAAKGPLSFEQLVQEVRKRVPKGALAAGQNLDWYTKSVQLDMEHRGRIERLEKPLRFKLPSGKKRTIRQMYRVKASPPQVWQMLVDREKVEAWSGAPAVMDAAVGTRFSLWGGDIHGENVDVVPERKLVQCWQEGDWKEPSTVTFLLRKTDEGTAVELVQTGIPAEEVEDIAQGWDEYYLGVIKRHFG